MSGANDTRTDSRQLLDLDTLITRDTISIDGERYEILNPDELSVIDSHRFGRWGNRIEQLAALDGEAEEKELHDLVERVSRKIMVGVPDDVFARLRGSQQWAVIDLFTGLLLRTKLKAAGAMKAAMEEAMPGLVASAPTGASPSPGSSGSTADSPPPGWWTRLSRWFAHTSG